MKNNYVSSNEGLVLRLLAPEEVHGINYVLETKVFYIVLVWCKQLLEILVERNNKVGSHHEMHLMKSVLSEAFVKLKSKTTQPS